MKLFSIVLILVALFGLLAFTNPKLDNYDQFISQRITEETRKEQEPMAGALGFLLGGFAANLMTNTVRRAIGASRIAPYVWPCCGAIQLSLLHPTLGIILLYKARMGRLFCPPFTTPKGP